MPETIDIDARSWAKSALESIKAHEEHCKERQAWVEASLDRIEKTLIRLGEKMSDGDGVVHTRIDRLVLIFALGSTGIVISVVGATLAYLVFGK